MKFTPQKLQDAFNIAEPIIKSIPEIQDTVSKEIKDLESFFQENQLPLDLCFEISSTVSGGGDHDHGVEEKEFLIWCASEKRLFFKRIQYDFVFDCGSGNIYYQNEKEVFNQCPLISTPFEIRKRIHENHLDNFVLEIAKQYHDLKKEDYEIPEDIDF